MSSVASSKGNQDLTRLLRTTLATSKAKQKIVIRRAGIGARIGHKVQQLFYGFLKRFSTWELNYMKLKLYPTHRCRPQRIKIRDGDLRHLKRLKKIVKVFFGGVGAVHKLCQSDIKYIFKVCRRDSMNQPKSIFIFIQKTTTKSCDLIRKFPHTQKSRDFLLLNFFRCRAWKIFK